MPDEVFMGIKSELSRATDSSVSTYSRVTGANLRRYARRFLAKEPIASIVQAARENGCNVEPVQRMRIQKFKKNELWINNYKCSVHFCKSRHRSIYYATYTSLGIAKSSIEVCDFVVVHVDVPQFNKMILVIPNWVFNQYFNRNPVTRAYIKIPIICRPAYNNVKPIINWLGFVDAWGYLNPKRDPS